MSKVSIAPYAAVFPVPVALVSAVGKDREPNLITLAWVANVCSDPPKVGISIRPHRHSHQLIKDTKEFVVNIPSENLLKKVDFCGTVSGKDHDKFKEASLTAIPGEIVRVPLVKECPVCIECKVEKIVYLGSHDLFIGEVVLIHIDEEAVGEDGYPDYQRIKPLTYLPPSDYFNLKQQIGRYGFSKGRP